ncbi:unnamed protein product [Lathyrus oleraceus]|nr:uncharacterized protein LOC127079099 [Pisum sativum]XP_050875472.1 uncharacterized protein LOC127079099 [Pisum sativum]XP_050875473.1 uncharacterized protein LOC127079099 [Pisum sativum]
MLPLKLVRSLILGESISIHNNSHFLNQNHHHHEQQEQPNETTRTRRGKRFKKRPGLLFLPTKEIITNTYRLATIARDLGMDLHPTPSLSHIIFSNPSSTPSTSSSSPSTPSTSTFSVSSASCSLLNDVVPIPFPSFDTAPLTHLRYFVTLFPRAFKLVLFDSDGDSDAVGSCGGGDVSNWDCSSVSLCCRVTGNRVDTMDGFCRILAGKGWTFFKTKQNPSGDLRGGGVVYLFRKVDVNRVLAGRVGARDGACRVREVRLPYLDFENAPLRILQYILLMTDDIFCLA